MDALRGAVASAVHRGSDAVDAFARHRKIDAVCVDDAKPAAGASRRASFGCYSRRVSDSPTPPPAPRFPLTSRPLAF